MKYGAKIFMNDRNKHQAHDLVVLHCRAECDSAVVQLDLHAQVLPFQKQDRRHSICSELEAAAVTAAAASAVRNVAPLKVHLPLARR